VNNLINKGVGKNVRIEFNNYIFSTRNVTCIVPVTFKNVQSNKT